MSLYTNAEDDNHLLRYVDCPVCGGYGGGEEVTGHDPSGPVIRWHTCDACDGAGRTLEPFKPITMEDLDDAEA